MAVQESPRGVTADEERDASCVEPECDYRVVSFERGDFYCRIHRPGSTVAVSCDHRWTETANVEEGCSYLECERCGESQTVWM